MVDSCLKKVLLVIADLYITECNISTVVVVCTKFGYVPLMVLNVVYSQI